jgi:hypothetical protein
MNAVNIVKKMDFFMIFYLIFQINQYVIARRNDEASSSPVPNRYT